MAAFVAPVCTCCPSSFKDQKCTTYFICDDFLSYLKSRIFAHFNFVYRQLGKIMILKTILTFKFQVVRKAWKNIFFFEKTPFLTILKWKFHTRSFPWKIAKNCKGCLLEWFFTGAEFKICIHRSILCNIIREFCGVPQ